MTDRVLGAVAALLLAAGLGASFGLAPPDAVQGTVQRIMYVHVPAILTAYAAIGVVFVKISARMPAMTKTKRRIFEKNRIKPLGPVTGPYGARASGTVTVPTMSLA